MRSRQARVWREADASIGLFFLKLLQPFCKLGIIYFGRWTAADEPPIARATTMLEPDLTADLVTQNEIGEDSYLDEDQLIGLAKTNRQFFGELYDRDYGRILNYIYRRNLDVAP